MRERVKRPATASRFNVQNAFSNFKARRDVPGSECAFGVSDPTCGGLRLVTLPQTSVEMALGGCLGLGPLYLSLSHAQPGLMFPTEMLRM